jgi:hypothetical protein
VKSEHANSGKSNHVRNDKRANSEITHRTFQYYTTLTWSSAELLLPLFFAASLSEDDISLFTSASEILSVSTSEFVHSFKGNSGEHSAMVSVEDSANDSADEVQPS